ncbi:MAG: arginase family protein, partial [Pseudomonadota bacterium]
MQEFSPSPRTALIGAPLECGMRVAGPARGPAALRGLGFAAALARRGWSVVDLGDIAAAPAASRSHANPAIINLSETSAWIAALAASAESAASEFDCPVFLGGDHAMAAGTVSGIATHAANAGRPLFVLWLDAHADMHTLETTRSGNLHGTPLAYVTGRPGFDGFPELAHAVDDANVCIVGARAIDADECAHLDDSATTVIGVEQLAAGDGFRQIEAFLARVAAADGLLHVSFDVDFIDPAIAPGTGTPVAGGATESQANAVADLIAASGRMTSLDIAEFNPLRDTGNADTGHRAVAIATRCFRQSVKTEPKPTEHAKEARMKKPLPSDLAFIPFVSVDNMMRLVNDIGIETVFKELSVYIEEDFKRWQEFDKRARVASHSKDGVIELMPAADRENYGFKYVNGHPKNMAQGFQTVTAFGVLSSVATGYPILLSEMTVLTALRTAATSALVGRYLMPPGAKTMAM